MARTSDILLILVAILFPPAAVIFLTGCSCDLLINFLLTSLGVLPGTIHAFWLIYCRMKAEERFGYGRLHYLGSGNFEPYPGVGYVQPGQPHQPVYYGATGP